MAAMSPQPPFPDASGALTLPGPAGALEVAVDLPEDDVVRVPAVQNRSLMASGMPVSARPSPRPSAASAA